MKVFVAGATGVIGRSLIPQLVRAGHRVTAMTRKQARTAKLISMGSEPVVCDVYDASGITQAVQRAQPDVVVHEITALPTAIDPRRIETQLAENDRIRIEGTRNLVAAARKAGVTRIVAESIAFAYAPGGSVVKDEDAPLWIDAPWPWRRSVAAIGELERQVLSTGGIDGTVLRYGSLYGPGTAYAPDGAIAEATRKRRFPIGGGGSGVFSFVHVEDAARATVAAIERGAAGVYNVTDDEPAALRDWLPVYAQALKAPHPRTVPGFVVRMLAGRYGLYLMTEQRGASNLRARGQLEWAPSFPTWRTGFWSALQK